MNNLIILNTIGLLPEIFLSISIIYLLIFGSILSTYKTYPLIQNLILNLSILILIFCLVLVLNDKLWIKEILLFNNTISHDYLSFISKIFILIFSTVCLIMIQDYIKDQKINQFEYIIIILLSILGFLILCSANDFITAYLAIELQSLAFYVMASFKKNSSFSVEAGLKYFILGSFSSAILLFGISLLYFATGSLNFEDYKDLYCNSFPDKQTKNIASLKLNFDSLVNSYCEYVLLYKLFSPMDFELYHLIDQIIKGEDISYQYELYQSTLSVNPLTDFELYQDIVFSLNTESIINSYSKYIYQITQIVDLNDYKYVSSCITPENFIDFDVFKLMGIYLNIPGFLSTYNNILINHGGLNILIFEEMLSCLNTVNLMENYDLYSLTINKPGMVIGIELFKEIQTILNPGCCAASLLDELFLINLNLHQDILLNKNLHDMDTADLVKLMVTLEHLQYEPNYFTDLYVHHNKFKSFIVYNLDEFSKITNKTYLAKESGIPIDTEHNLFMDKITIKIHFLKIQMFHKLLEDEWNCQNLFYSKYVRICNNFLDYEPTFLLDSKEHLLHSNTISNELVLFSLMLIFVSLIFKLAIAPLHAWSPDVYEGSPTSSTIFFAVVSKLSLLVLLLRIFYHSFHGLVHSWNFYIVLIAVLSVMVGSFTALEQKKLKSLFAYSSTSHLGYILIAFCAGTLEGIQSIIAYIIIYMLSSSCIWSILILLKPKDNYNKKANKDLADIASLIKSNSILGLIFSTTLFSIAGFPPLIGFFTKMNVFLSAIESSMYFVAIISILSSVISTFYYIRIIKIVCFENNIVGRLYHPLPYLGTLIVVIKFLLIIFLFINPTMLFLISHKISLLYFH